MDHCRGVAVVADNLALSRSGALALLQEIGFSTVAAVEDFASLNTLLAKHSDVELLLINPDLPGIAILSDLRQLREKWPHLRLMVIGGPFDRTALLQTLSVGVHGIIDKSLDAPEMEQAITTVLEGGIYLPSSITDLAEQPQQGNSDTPVFTARQYEILKLVAAGASNKMIARSLSIAEGTVKAHVNATFKLLGVHNRMGAALAFNRLAGTGASTVHQRRDEATSAYCSAA